MNRNILTVVLVITILALGGSIVWSMIGQRELQSQINLKETEVADIEATLVQVFSDQREVTDISEDQLATAEAELVTLRQEATAVAPLVATQSAQEGLPTNTPIPTAATDIDAAPQVRIRLLKQQPIQVVGEPLEIIVSASHPVGIASLNILVDGELLLQRDPFDPRMEIAITEWTPLEIGSYQIKAIATTIRGRASDPVILEIEVIETNDPEVLLNTELRLIERNVQELRGLDQIGELSINVIDRNNLQSNIIGDLFGEFTREDAERDVLVLSSFDFMARDYPLYDSLVDLYGAVVAGYYDDQTDSLYVVSDDNMLDEEEKLTHAHEFMHALQDQHFVLSDLANGELDSDAALALRSLAEGEASLVEFLYQSRGYLTGEQKADNNPVFTVPDSIPAPNFLVSQLAFPYVRGQEFLAEAFEERGFEIVNEIWQSPPQSTEQILHVDRYWAGDAPIKVELPSDQILANLGSDWELLTEDVFGEFNIIEYLSIALEEDEVNPAALGWGGDRYAVFYNRSTDERIMALRVVWDTPEDQVEFVNSYFAWAKNYLGDNTNSADDQVECWENISDIQCLIILDKSVVITRADSLELSQAINQQMKHP